MEDHKSINLILMGNTMQLESTKYIENIFDLKGSLTGRRTKGRTTNTTVLKDLNIREVRGDKLVSDCCFIVLVFEILKV